MNEYYAPGDFILRSPILPVTNIDNIPVNLSDFFKELAKNEFFLVSIYIASSQLYHEYLKWKEGKLSYKKEEEKLLLSLLKYWLRMSTRCTPYGSFAGWALGKIGDETKIILDTIESHRAHSRIDMNIMAEIVQQLLKKPEIKLRSKYYPNNSSYFVGNDYRYIEYNIINNSRGYKMSEVNINEHVKIILERAAGGATIPDLAKELVDDEITDEEALAFIEELVESKVLISEFEPTITGNPFLGILIEKLEAINEKEELIHPLKKIQNLLDTTLLRIDKLDEAIKIVKSILPSSPSKDIIQTDLYLSSKRVVVKKEITEAVIDACQKLARISVGGGTVMRPFITKFSERYQDEEIALMHALDPEVGIGYNFVNSEDNITFLRGINANSKNQNTELIAWNNLRDFQIRKLNDALLNNKEEIEITEEELEILGDNQNLNIADSFAIYGTLLGGVNKLESGDWKFHIKACSGPSAANLLGRFCYQDELLTKKMRECLKVEESHQPDCIFAEIVHSPQDRLGNIMLRPILRTYEIPYVSVGAVLEENQILVSDLYVSVRSNEIILRSKRLNKRVIPRMANAHNFSAQGNLPVYKFLCDLQFQGITPGYLWDWGKLSNCAYLPRVTYRKVILSKAQWRLDKAHQKVLEKKSVNLADYFSKLQIDNRIPHFVTMTEGDSELFIDMRNENCLKILRDTLVKRQSVHLSEFLSSSDNCIVENEDGFRFANEIVIPVNKKVVEKPNVNANGLINTEPHLQRTFIVGSEWLYVKIYCGIKSAEEILKKIVRPITETLITDGVIDKWFFIRYSDPDHHLRIRFHGIIPEHYAVILKRINTAVSKFIADGHVQKIQIDTYQRELERYGTQLIELSEDLFHHDSEAVIQFIELLETDADEQFRWLFALRGTDMILDDFNFSPEEKMYLLKKISQNFLTEFSNEKLLRKQINDRYRFDAKMIFKILNPENDVVDEVEEAVTIFNKRSVKNKVLYETLIKKCPDSYKNKIDQLIPSYLHMFLNRLFQSNQRKQELVVYTYLHRYYESSQAIKKKESVKESIQ